MSSQAPASSPAHAPPPSVSNAPVRRSFTLPARIASKSPSPAPVPSTDGIETLFVCASTKIASFTASSSTRRASPSRRRSPSRENAAPSIPWRSPTDRTLAVGPLRIYRVTSSNVSFLNSGNLLHTIFPKSQCWCVDGESVFVLRIRQDTYYRMELPHQTAEDKEKVEDFKKVLGQVLQYEKTRCPFTRGFEVELPERPKTPPRRRLKKPAEKAKKWTFDKTWMPEDGSRPCTPILEGSDPGTGSSYDEDDASSISTDRSDAVVDSPATEPTPPRPVVKPAPKPRLSVSERAMMFQEMRSVTAPVTQSNREMSISSEAIPEQVAKEPEVGEVVGEASLVAKPHLERKDSADAQSIVSTVDSFYSFETPRSPSPPFLDAEADPANPWAGERSIAEGEGRGRSKHRRQTSELTVRAPSEHGEEAAPVTPTDNQHMPTPTIEVRLSSAPSTPPLVDDSDDDSINLPSLDVTTPPDAIRMRRLTGASQKRAFSPMPHPQNLFCPPVHSRQRQFTHALIRKTAEIVLGPPAHLVQLMLRIAARISDGVFSFNTYRVRNNTENIPGSWLSDDDDDEEEEEHWPEEDDFGIPLRNINDDSPPRHRGFAADVD